MMKCLGLLLLLVSAVAGQKSRQQIRNDIVAFYNSPTYASVGRLTIPTGSTSYQAKALAQTQDALEGVAQIDGQNVDATRVINYYVLACIFHATNGITNPKVPPGQPILTWTLGVDGDNRWFNEVNYCEWLGVVCFDDREPNIAAQEENGEIIELLLANFTMFGEWPSEVCFLGGHLVTIDLFANYFLYAEDYTWFNVMNRLEFLFFGTTSWFAEGIPEILGQLTTLRELDISNTFWTEGEIRALAFAPLINLRYLKMGDNIYNTATQTQLPPGLVQLPSLIRLYMQNCRFTPNRPNFQFVASMPAIIELWADYTRFNQGIPASMGTAVTLRSFSCVYCNLKNQIPTELVKTALDRLWLTGNKLTGPIPAILGVQLKFRFFYVEDNDLTGPLPESLCSQTQDADPNTRLLELGGDCGTQCPTPVESNSCCTCCGAGCGNLVAPTPAPTGPPTSGFCFSGDSNVEVENKGQVKMIDLALGDSVKVADNTYERVYSFGHKNDSASAEFVRIATEGSRKPLELSKDHMVMIEDGRNVPASMIQRGDKLVTASGELTSVESIRTVVRKGAYAPFTESGSIIVNDIAASNYVAFQGAEYLELCGFKTPLSWQWIAHTFNSFHRVAVMMGVKGETYTESGVSNWVNAPNQYGLWLLDQSSLVILAVLIPSVAFFGFFSLLEMLMLNHVASLTVVAGLLTVFVARRTFSVKMSSKQM